MAKNQKKCLKIIYLEFMIKYNSILDIKNVYYFVSLKHNINFLSDEYDKITNKRIANT